MSKILLVYTNENEKDLLFKEMYKNYKKFIFLSEYDEQKIIEISKLLNNQDELIVMLSMQKVSDEENKFTELYLNLKKLPYHLNFFDEIKFIYSQSICNFKKDENKNFFDITFKILSFIQVGVEKNIFKIV